MTFNEFNTLSKEEASLALGKCCVSNQWISKMVDARPFNSENELIQKAASIWYDECSNDDFKEAFTGHPKIGDVASLKGKNLHILKIGRTMSNPKFQKQTRKL